jgi:hypothetical protein
LHLKGVEKVFRKTGKKKLLKQIKTRFDYSGKWLFLKRLRLPEAIVDHVYACVDVII